MKRTLSLNEVHPSNYRYLQEDRNFSAERNYHVIEGVLKDNDEMQAKLKEEVKENAGNAADILAGFAKYKLDQGGGKKIEKWLGKEWMKKVYGDKLVEKIRRAEIIREQNLKNGNTLYGGNFYLK